MKRLQQRKRKRKHHSERDPSSWRSSSSSSFSTSSPGGGGGSLFFGIFFKSHLQTLQRVHHLLYVPNLRTGFQKDEHLFKHLLSRRHADLGCALHSDSTFLLRGLASLSRPSAPALPGAGTHITVQLLALSFRKSVATADSSGLLGMCEIRFVAR